MPIWSNIALATMTALLSTHAGTNGAIVVSASRLDALSVDVLDVPSDVTVLDRQSIDHSKAQSVPDLLRQEANVRFRSTTGKGNSGELAMRGFGENSGLRVLVVVDGQKMNRPDMGGLDWQQLPLEDIESIEVLRGGHGVLYGNHAVSGVIKITTRKGGKTAGHVKATFGSFGFEEYSGRLSGAVGSVFGDVGANYQRDEGYRDNSLTWSKNANASLGLDCGEASTLTMRLSAGQNHYQFPGALSYDQFLEDPTQSSNNGDEFSETDNALATLLCESETDWGNIQLNGGVDWSDTDWTLANRTGQNEQYGCSVSPKFLLGDDAESISFGFDMFYDLLDFVGMEGSTVSTAEMSRITTGPFVWAKKDLSETWTISGGARYEYAYTEGENVQYTTPPSEPFIPNPWGVLIPNPDYPAKAELDEDSTFDGDVEKDGWAVDLAVNWRPTDTIGFWWGYDRVYRYPALDETASYQGYPLANPMNAALDPETGNNFELGGKFNSAPWFGSATLFLLLMDNEISFDEAANLNVNMGSTRRCGGDLFLGYETKWYGASVAAELVDAIFDGGEFDGNTVPLVPVVHAKQSLWVSPLTGIYTWQASQYRGGDFGNEFQKIDPIGLFGLRAEYSFDKHISAYANVENLLDKKYVDSAYGGGYYPGSGRAVYGGIKVGF